MIFRLRQSPYDEDYLEGYCESEDDLLTIASRHIRNIYYGVNIVSGRTETVGREEVFTITWMDDGYEEKTSFNLVRINHIKKLEEDESQ